MMDCDPDTGTCFLPQNANETISTVHQTATIPTVRYIGDPMCSWCWGISPELKKVAEYCQNHGIGFGVTVSGLRPGGGDAWNEQFKAFLRHEWENIQRVTGQPFGFSLLDKDEFNYDTEPPCRAVVVMSKLLERHENSSRLILEFLSGIQYRFYVDGEDPKSVEFYRELCSAAGVAYEDFLNAFLSSEAKAATAQEFERCRHWGVRGFPSILLDNNGGITLLSSGYTSSATLIAKLETLLGENKCVANRS